MTPIQHQPTSFAPVANAGSSVGRVSLVLRNGRSIVAKPDFVPRGGHNGRTDGSDDGLAAGRSPARPVRRIEIEHLHLPIPQRERRMRLGDVVVLVDGSHLA
jgi:hypothetical protein